MKILIDIGHPAHVHYFRNLYYKLHEKHQIWITCRDTRIVKFLLEHYKLPYQIISSKQDSILTKIGSQLLVSNKIRQLINKNDIDIAMGVSGAAVLGALQTKAISILFDDDDQSVQPITRFCVTPYADTVLSPDTLKYENLRSAAYYPGYHELAYLHPCKFKPNPAVIHKYCLTEGEDYFVLRFNAFKAHHDIKEGGMSIKQKRELVSLLKSKGKVFITTEAQINPEFEKYKLPIPPHEIHDFLYFAKMFVSDSQTMSSEAAVLGVPSFRCNSFSGRISYLEEEEKKYGLTYGFLPRQFDWMLARIKETLDMPNSKEHWATKRNKLLEDKIDVTAFWAWFIENYPKSRYLTMKRGFDYNQFR